MKKRVLSVFLTLVMMLCMMPIEVFAGNKVSVSTLDDLLVADKLNEMISVKKDIVISTVVSLELDNTKIYYTTDPSTSVDTKIIIESTGSLTVTSKEEGSNNGMDIQIDNYGTLRVSGCELTYGVDNYGTITSGEFNCAVNNDGTISGGSFTGAVTNNGSISLGTFSGAVTNGSEGVISNGTFSGNGNVENKGTISGGTFGGNITNDGTISGGTFTGAVTNGSGGVISAGTFNNNVTNNGTISGGSFRGAVTNGSTGVISGGTFTCDVTNEGTVTGGMYYTPLTNNGKIDGLTVTYRNGGTQYAMEVLQSSETAEKPNDPLDGTGESTVWYSDEACTTVYDFNTPVSGNITLYGQKDTQGPTITGIEDGKTYCGISELIFSVKDNNQVASVTINGTEVAPYNPDNPDFYKITGDMFTDGIDVTVIATDVSGNATSVTVTLYEYHEFIWYSKNGKYWSVCSQCGETSDEMDIPYSTFDGQAMTCGSDTYTFTVYPPTRPTDETTPDTYPSEITTDIENFSGEISTVYSSDYLSYTVTITGIPADCTGFKVILKQVKAVNGFTFDEEYEVSAHALTHVEKKGPTTSEAGNREYWYCDVCEKYFSDAAGANVIPDGKDGVVLAKLPVITKGDGQKITAGEKKSLEFTSDAEYAEFSHVLIDGKELDAKNYTAAAAADGSTVITLKADYVATLSNGEHTIGIVSESGTATVTFTVNKKAAETTTTTKKSATGGTKAPQTGDNSNISLWLALLLVSSSAVTAATIASKKKKYNG